MIDLSGFWDFRFDPGMEGDAGGWASGFGKGRPIAVPASWNDQFEDGRDYLGVAWYQTRFDLPWGWDKAHVFVRFASVNYLAEVWLNGVRLGQHEGGHLPFEFDVTRHVKREGNVLVVRVDGELAPDRVPPGNVPRGAGMSFLGNYPAAGFDFFPFCGIQRPVLLYTRPGDAIGDVTVVTDIKDKDGIVSVSVETSGGAPATARLTLRGCGADVTATAPVAGSKAGAVLTVPNAALWAPGSPNLYDLTVELLGSGDVVDRYTLPIGIRTFSVQGDALLLNGQPVMLKGFGRHEDFPVSGRGLAPAVIIKDYALMKWVGANSFRTTHYPYSEQMMDLADRLGFMVIDETPAVGLFFQEQGLQRRLELCQQYTRELIARDKNHPSVIMWSLANEPHSALPAAKPFFRTLYDLAKSLDGTRPVTLVNMGMVKEEAMEFIDVICVNRYPAWYSDSGRIAEALPKLVAEMDALHAQYPKPFILTEFGADCVAGTHAQPPEMFSEEYQAEIILAVMHVLREKAYMCGYHVWNLCDFKTSQGVIRVGGLNLKGVFTRDRRPKLAAHRLRELWTK
jgi:beta-glucuronidase